MDGLQLIAKEPFVFGFAVCFCTSIWVWVCLIFWEFTILQTNKEVPLWRQTQKELESWQIDFPSCFASSWTVVGQDPLCSGMKHLSQAEWLSLSFPMPSFNLGPPRNWTHNGVFRCWIPELFRYSCHSNYWQVIMESQLIKRGSVSYYIYWL